MSAHISIQRCDVSRWQTNVAPNKWIYSHLELVISFISFGDTSLLNMINWFAILVHCLDTNHEKKHTRNKCVPFFMFSSANSTDFNMKSINQLNSTCSIVNDIINMYIHEKLILKSFWFFDSIILLLNESGPLLKWTRHTIHERMRLKWWYEPVVWVSVEVLVNGILFLHLNLFNSAPDLKWFDFQLFFRIIWISRENPSLKWLTMEKKLESY